MFLLLQYLYLLKNFDLCIHLSNRFIGALYNVHDVNDSIVTVGTPRSQ